jgi:hypothetical protein
VQDFGAIRVIQSWEELAINHVLQYANDDIAHITLDCQSEESHIMRAALDSQSRPHRRLINLLADGVYHCCVTLLQHHLEVGGSSLSSRCAISIIALTLTLPQLAQFSNKKWIP